MADGFRLTMADGFQCMFITICLVLQVIGVCLLLPPSSMIAVGASLFSVGSGGALFYMFYSCYLVCCSQDR